MKIESRLGKGLSTFFENRKIEVPVFHNPADVNNAGQGEATVQNVNTNVDAMTYTPPTKVEDEGSVKTAETVNMVTHSGNSENAGNDMQKSQQNESVNPVQTQSFELKSEAQKMIESGEIKYIPLGNIYPNENQQRKKFKEEQLRELANSIEKNGVLQPILVRFKKGSHNTFEIIAGERRWRAANFAGLREIPVIVKDFSDRESFEIGLIENLQRENLSPIEEAQGYKKLMTNFDYTQEDVSKIMNKSRSYIANVIRLLNLPAEVQDMVNNGDISYSIARSLVSMEDPLKAAKAILRNDMTVKEIQENIADKKLKALKKKNDDVFDATNLDEDESEKQYKKVQLEQELISIRENLSDTLNAEVDIKMRGRKGQIVIHFSDLEELNNITTKLNNI